MSAEPSEGGNVLKARADGAVDRYRSLVDLSPDPMCVHARGNVVYVNPAGMREFGALVPEELVGRTITEFVHPGSIDDMLMRIVALTEEGDSSEPSEATLLRLDGSPVEVEAVSVLTTWDGEPAYQVIFRDLTTQKAAEAALRYQAALVSHVSDAIIGTTADGVVTSWNPAAEKIYRRPAARVVGLPLSDAVDADLDLAEIVAEGGVLHAVHRAADGAPVNVRVSVTAMDDGFALLCSDYSAQRKAETHFQSVVNCLHEGVIVLDQDGTPQSINPAALRILGLKRSVERDYRDGAISFAIYDSNGHCISDHERPFIARLFNSVPIEGMTIGVDRPDGVRVWVSLNCCLLDPADPQHSSVLVSFSDVTAERTAKAQLAYQAHHDPLTGLPNRAQIESRIASAKESTKNPLAAVMFVDIDNLKSINDDLGHHAGDIAIKEAACRLQSGLRSEDFVGRLSGDEFVVLLHGVMDRATIASSTARLHTALLDPLYIGGVLRSVKASIGVSEVALGDTRLVDEILRDADAAMYRAKASRTGTHYA